LRGFIIYCEDDNRLEGTGLNGDTGTRGLQARSMRGVEEVILKTTVLLSVVAAIVFLWNVPVYLSADEQLPGSDILLRDELLQLENEAIRWLKEQMVPNTIVQEPSPLRRRLVISYRIPETHQAFQYIYSRSFSYDNALAVIALTMAGAYQEAELILTALQRNMRDDGSFWFAHNTENSWPNEGDNEGAIIRTGAVCWIGYAVVFFLSVREQEDELFLEEELLAQDLLDMAERIGEWVLARQVHDPSDLRHGLVTGGMGNYQLEVDKKENNLLEHYHRDEITWVSMEHNIDAYYFLRDLGRLTADGRYRRASEEIAKRLLTLWSKDKGQLIRGVKGDQTVDDALPLDGASWASLFMSSIGERAKARRCLQTIERNFHNQSKGIRGYRPYYADPVFEEREVNAYFYPDDPDTRWCDINIVWVEGSLGVAAAYIKSGQKRKAVDIMEAMMPLSCDGGMPYATVEIPYQFSIDPSVASTAWFVIVLEMLRKPERNALFWDR
jgi:hypothetical protein